MIREGFGLIVTTKEWFFSPKGLRLSEIGCRPPGVGQWDVYCAADEFDLYREWAVAVSYGRIAGYMRFRRRFSSAIAFSSEIIEASMPPNFARHL